jgi:hypothetical protein
MFSKTVTFSLMVSAIALKLPRATTSRAISVLFGSEFVRMILPSKYDPPERDFLLFPQFPAVYASVAQESRDGSFSRAAHAPEFLQRQI